MLYEEISLWNIQIGCNVTGVHCCFLVWYGYSLECEFDIFWYVEKETHEITLYSYRKGHNRVELDGDNIYKYTDLHIIQNGTLKAHGMQ